MDEATTDNQSETGAGTDAGTSEAGHSDGHQTDNESVHSTQQSSPDKEEKSSKKDKKKKKDKHHHHKHKHHHEKEEKQKKGIDQKVVLFICDPQNDYSDQGTIPIPNAMADSNRIYDLIMDHLDDISEIYVALDSRHRTHISNQISWTNKKGKRPEPFQVITAQEVAKGKWKAKQKVLQQEYSDYVTNLEKAKKQPFMIWPDHCLVGTYGHAVMPSINEALQTWAGHNLTTVEYIIKATNCFTEMYSALSGEVPDPNDPSTELDLGMVERLAAADRVIFCGESLSHSVQMTMKDVISNWKEEEVEKLCLLSDCSSPVPGFESMAEDFVRECKEKGVKVVPASESFEFDDEMGEEEFADSAAVVNIAHKMASKEHKKHSSKEKDNDTTEAAPEATSDAPAA
jgi:nicotinamidase/pyrazinamidase